VLLTVAICTPSNGQTGPRSRPAAPSGPAIKAPSFLAGPVAKITVSTAVVLHSTGSVGTLAWRAEPPEALRYCVPATGEPDALLFYWPGHPKVAFTLISAAGSPPVIVTTRYEIAADGEPQPDPFPPPDPPPPVKVTAVVIIYETATRTPAQAAVMLDRGWKDALEARDPPVEILVRDRDQLPQRLQPLKAKADKGPVVCFVDESGDDVSTAVCLPMPETIEGLNRLLKDKVA